MKHTDLQAIIYTLFTQYERVSAQLAVVHWGIAATPWATANKDVVCLANL